MGAIVLGALSLPLHYPPLLRPANELSRLYLTQAIVDDGSLSTDGPTKRYGANDDFALHEGRHYSDKAPGVSFLAIPIYAAARLLGLGPDRLHAHIRLQTFLLLILPSVLMLGLIARFTAAVSGSSELAGWSVATAWLVASPSTFYATTLFGHHAAALALIGACEAARRARLSGSHGLFGAAGLLAGLAVLCELPAALLALFVAGFALWPWGPGDVRPRLSSALALAAGAAVPAAMLIGYNVACFGSALSLSYASIGNPSFTRFHHMGVLGLGPPRPEVIPYWLWGAERGLLPVAPWMGLAALGCMLRPRRAAIACGLAFLAFTVALSGYFKPSGGACVGPRHLGPALFLLLPLCARALDGAIGRRLFLGASAAAVLFVWSFHATLPYAVQSDHPIGEQALPLVLSGSYAASNLPGLGGLRTPIAFATLALALAAIIISQRPRVAQMIWGLAVVGALVFATIAIAEPDNIASRLERADARWAMGIDEKYAVIRGPDGNFVMLPMRMLSRPVEPPSGSDQVRPSRGDAPGPALTPSAPTR
ncbi:MAG: hypothetical protein AABZ30_01135 [Myxococcota bacterium]